MVAGRPWRGSRRWLAPTREEAGEGYRERLRALREVGGRGWNKEGGAPPQEAGTGAGTGSGMCKRLSSDTGSGGWSWRRRELQEKCWKACQQSVMSSRFTSALMSVAICWYLRST